ncbi:cilium assembly protein DZIP1-like [Stegostoma tigrinum]|uniref:cilium assembly protein DZIP1-like n=1 Tax=Stegostoma tigrinum TaxID=3053191 RepID=UPI0028701048|nr:cilium assembly protein DZIP1-like [Stegostoma tigrinum]
MAGLTHEDVQGISEGQLTRILDTVDSDREEKSKVFPNFYLYRESLSRKVEDKIKGKEDLCRLKNKFASRISGKSDNVLSKVSQPSCSKICKTKAPSPKLSSTTLSTTSSASDEFVGTVSSDTTSAESSENQMSETCELEEVCTFENLKSTENNSAGSKSVEKGLTESIEEELSRRLMARTNKSLKLPVKKVVRELKFAEKKNDDVWEVSSVDDDTCLITKPETEKDSSAVAKADQLNSAHGNNIMSKSSGKATK